jgi:hypothetical protein
VQLISGKAARLLFGGAGLLLIFSACSSDNSAPAVGSAIANAPTTLVGAAPTVVAPVDGATTTVAPAAPAPAPVDGASLLQQGLAAIGGGYHFNQTATVDGVVVLTADGDRLPDGTRLTLTGDGGVVSYVITPGGSFALAEGGEWEALDAEPDAVDPILSLFTPTSVAVAGDDGVTVQLAVTVPIASLGIAGEGDVPLQVTFVSGALTNIAYSTTLEDGRVAAVNAAIGPAVDASPVVAPI